MCHADDPFITLSGIVVQTGGTGDALHIAGAIFI
jgi:hypothetical protein